MVSKKVFKKISQYSQENTYVRVSFFKTATLFKKRLCHRGFPVNFAWYLWMTASNLQQLLALYFAIIDSCQHSGSEKSLVGEKLIHTFQGFYRFRFPLHIFFFIFLDKYLFTSPVTQSVCCTLAANRFVGSETAKHNAFDQFWKFKFRYFPKNTWFLSFERPINYLHLYRNHRHLRTTDFRDQVNVRHLTSKLLKCGLVQALSILWNLSSWIFATGKASLVFY